MVYAILYAGQIKTILFLNYIKEGAIGAFLSILSYLYSNKNCRLATSDYRLAKFNIKASALILNLCYNHRSPTLHILLHGLVLHIFFDASVNVLNSHALVTVSDFDRLARCRAFYRWGRRVVIFLLRTG